MIIHTFSMFYMSLFIYLYFKMMKVRPSLPSSEDHYILKEIMLQRTKVFNYNICVALFLMYSL
jgi:hypothetical protein